VPVPAPDPRRAPGLAVAVSHNYERSGARGPPHRHDRTECTR
jgi:hypothetical protein